MCVLLLIAPTQERALKLKEADEIDIPEELLPLLCSCSVPGSSNKTVGVLFSEWIKAQAACHGQASAADRPDGTCGAGAAAFPVTPGQVRIVNLSQTLPGDVANQGR